MTCLSGGCHITMHCCKLFNIFNFLELLYRVEPNLVWSINWEEGEVRRNKTCEFHWSYRSKTFKDKKLKDCQCPIFIFILFIYLFIYMYLFIYFYFLRFYNIKSTFIVQFSVSLLSCPINMIQLHILTFWRSEPFVFMICYIIFHIDILKKGYISFKFICTRPFFDSLCITLKQKFENLYCFQSSI